MFMTPIPSLRGLFCLSTGNASTCTGLYTLLETKTGVLPNRWSITIQATRTKLGCFSFSMQVLVAASVYCFVAPTLVTSRSIIIGTGGELEGSIFRLTWNKPLMLLSMKDVPSRTGIVGLLKISNFTCTWLSPIWTCSTIVPATSTFRLVAMFSCRISPWRMERSQSGSTKFSWSNLGSVPVSKTQLVRLMRDAVRPVLMVAL